MLRTERPAAARAAVDRLAVAVDFAQNGNVAGNVQELASLAGGSAPEPTTT
jgi:hypothetical protein